MLPRFQSIQILICCSTYYVTIFLYFELVSNVTPFLTNLKCSATGIGEGFLKQKWKFEMAFAMKGGRGGSRAIKVF